MNPGTAIRVLYSMAKFRTISGMAAGSLLLLGAIYLPNRPPGVDQSQQQTSIHTSVTLNSSTPRPANHWKVFMKPNKEELKKKLSPLQYHVTQEDGTERAFQNEYWDNKAAGLYVDVVSGEPLFSSLDKFESGTGWPSFTKPLEPDNLLEKVDRSHGMMRTEVRSKRGDSHLGHLFPDGPKPTGMRYCMNSASMRFVPVDKLEEEGYGDYLNLFKKAEAEKK